MEINTDVHEFGNKLVSLQDQLDYLKHQYELMAKTDNYERFCLKMRKAMKELETDFKLSELLKKAKYRPDPLVKKMATKLLNNSGYENKPVYCRFKGKAVRVWVKIPKEELNRVQ